MTTTETYTCSLCCELRPKDWTDAELAESADVLESVAKTIPIVCEECFAAMQRPVQ